MGVLVVVVADWETVGFADNVCVFFGQDFLKQDRFQPV